MKIPKYLYAAWLVALMATLGSLFFSEVMGFVPCSLCWYQRIFMYPVAILLTVGVYINDVGVIRYVVPLAVIGWFFAFYHNLLMWGVIPESVTPCRSGVPCSTRYIEYLDFITIPFLSLLAFSFILILIFQWRKNYDK